MPPVGRNGPTKSEEREVTFEEEEEEEKEVCSGLVSVMGPSICVTHTHSRGREPKIGSRKWL